MRNATLFITTVLLLALPAQAQEIAIDSIVPDELVSGKVSGLPAGEIETHKVVLYVKTDQWYVHPFASGGEGSSYAGVKADGSWTIRTVRRQFPADRMAAILVPRSQSMPARVESIASIKSVARVIRELVGTPDHGSL